MRILHVIDSMVKGGAERQLSNLLGPYADLGVENHLVTLWPGWAYGPKTSPYLARCELAVWEREKFSAFPLLVRMARDVDAVHTHLITSDIVGRLAGFIARKPLFSTLHTMWYSSRSLQLLPVTIRAKVQVVRTLDAASARPVRRFFAVSESVRDVYVRALHLPPDRVELTPNAVDPREFDPARFRDRDMIRASFGLTPEDIAISIVARLGPEKDHATAIAAAAELARERPIRLLLAGDGPRERNLRDIQRTLGAPVTFLGVCDDVPRLLFASDLFVLPSIFDGGSIVLKEAMTMGVPCIASDIPENHDITGDAAAYFPPGNVGALVEATRQLLASPERRQRMIALGRQRSAGFEPHRIAAQIVRSIQAAL